MYNSGNYIPNFSKIMSISAGQIIRNCPYYNELSRYNKMYDRTAVQDYNI